MTTKAEIRAALAKAVYSVGRPSVDGSLLVDPAALVDALAQLDMFGPAPKRDDEGDEANCEGEDEVDGYDPAKEGKEMAKKQIAARSRAQDARR